MICQLLHFPHSPWAVFRVTQETVHLSPHCPTVSRERGLPQGSRTCPDPSPRAGFPPTPGSWLTGASLAVRLCNPFFINWLTSTGERQDQLSECALQLDGRDCSPPPLLIVAGELSRLWEYLLEIQCLGGVVIDLTRIWSAL